jgi:type II pantothenate kinase
MSLRLGIDFGLTNTDAVLVQDGRLVKAWTLHFSAGASPETLGKALEVGGVKPHHLSHICTTGGRHRDLPEAWEGVPIFKAGEAESVGRGGLALAGVDEALVVSAGTGTSMIAARSDSSMIAARSDSSMIAARSDSSMIAARGSFQHITGSAVGGGTLLGLAKLLIGTSDPLEIAQLAEAGDTSGVDSTLIDAIGGGIGHLPPSATAVNFGKVPKLSTPPKPEDIAAGLFTIVGQVIAVIAINAAKAAGLKQVVIVGHLADLKPTREAIERVWGFYQVEPAAIVPEQRGYATALGAALS